MDYVALKNEILIDPLELGFAPYVAEGNHSAIADLGNGTLRTVTKTISVDALLMYIAQTGIITRLEKAKTHPSEAISSPALAVFEMMRSPFATPLNVNDPRVQGMVAALVAGGTITETEKNGFIALSQVAGSRFEEVIGQNASHYDVAIALNT
jgi:hypothetical protein